MHRVARFDAPFWGVLLMGILAVGTAGCFGLAAVAQHLAYAGQQF